MGGKNYTKEEWLTAVFKENPEFEELYDYSQTEYKGSREKVNIVCKKHGEFSVEANAHRKGEGCKECYLERKRGNKEEFIEKAIEKHGVRYDYSKVVYKDRVTKVDIICPEHGVFSQKPSKHLRGQGCPYCANMARGRKRRNSFEEVVEQAKEVHKDKYVYKGMFYDERKKGILNIECTKCGSEFQQPVKEHIHMGHVCRHCAKLTSRVEGSVFDFVKAICPDAEQSNRTILDDGKELDIFVPSKRVAIEVNGIFWHGDNHKSRDYHYKKWQACKEKGIRLIQITDYDWENNQKVFSQLLAHALGCNGERKVNARECEVVHLKSRECKEFYNAYHPQGHSPNPINLALKTKEGEIVAIMSFGYGKTTRGQARANGTTKATWELSRFASSCSVRGGASRLFKTFIRENNPEEVSSFSMNDYFAGGVYGVLGFVAETYGKSDYRVFHPFSGLRHKSYWQRRNIPKRLKELGKEELNFDPETDQRTEREIEDLVGAIRLWDSGKIKWVWRAEEKH